jgi:hypothetical protein
MFRTTQTLPVVPTVFGTGFIAPRVEHNAPSRFVDDREPLYKEFAKRLHRLVWCEG